MQADRIVPTREVVLVALLVLLVWALQLRYPPLSYPHIGLVQLLFLCMVAVMQPVRLLRSMHGAPAPRLHPAFLPALVFVVWTLVRWFAAGLPFTGAGDVGTIMWCSTYGIVGYTLTRSAASVDFEAPSISTSRFLLTAISAMGLMCGIHAVWQYFFSYSESYQQLLSEIGNRTPDRTEMGLLYHLQLRRVASIFGDPNSLATFSAVAVAASLELTTRAGSAGRNGLRILGFTAIPACLAAVFLSGSRGGLLDVLLVLLVFGGYLLYQNRKGKSRHSNGNAAALVLLAVFLVFQGTGPRAQMADVTKLPSPEYSTKQTGWTWRSSTITERIHYLTVGARMIKMAPVTGLGPGSVERYFGRLKPPEARESKYLHNWVIQIWAELGIVGVAAAGWFLVTMTIAVGRTRLWRRPADRAILTIFCLLLIDGLIQVTWNQRELMSTFGLITGVLMGRSVYQATSARERFPKPARLGIVVIYVTLFAIMEARFLAGKSDKYKALDAMSAGDPLLARHYWDQAILWTPGDPQPYAAQASIFASAGQWSPAKRLVDKALTLNPDSAALQVEAARIAEQLKRPDEARAYLTKALELYPSQAEYNYLMARHLYRRGNPQEALNRARIAAHNNYIEHDQAQYDALVNELENLTQP